MDVESNAAYTSRRSPVLARGGMVASSQPLATMAGIEILRRGGNAADAAVAVAAALNVAQPGSTGLGGDCFCLYYDAATRAVKAMNGSGRSAAAATMDHAEAEGLSGRLPAEHGLAVTVPGAAAGWEDAVRQLGRLPLADVLAPAIRLADRGFPVAPLTALGWCGPAEAKLRRHRHGGELLIDGRGPRPGEVMRNPNFAQTLRTLADGGAEAFYRGPIGERIVEAVAEAGGLLTAGDLAAHRSQWVEPICIDYRHLRVWECPPNGQGLAALLALNVVKRFDLADTPPGSFRRLHLLIEAMRLAFADVAWYVADPEHEAVPVDELLSEDYAARRAGRIDPGRANLAHRRGRPPAGSDTVYFCTADAEGNACSFINSIYVHFGTGIVPEGCGFALQNRGSCFVLERGHPNCLAPRKRPYHTIIPGMLTWADGGGLFGPFGVMGGMMQPQGHLQVVTALADDGVDPQAALDRPRFQLADGEPAGAVLLEPGLPTDVMGRLATAGHELRVVSARERGAFGLGQIIHRDADSGVLWGGSDPRGDGMAAGVE